MISLTHFWDWTGFPVVALPAALGASSGLPVSVSLIGPAASDWQTPRSRRRTPGRARHAVLAEPSEPTLNLSDAHPARSARCSASVVNSSSGVGGTH